MELDDLKAAWAATNARVEEMHAESQQARVRAIATRLNWMPAFELVIAVLTVVWSGGFLYDNFSKIWTMPAGAIPVGVLYALSIYTIWLSVRQFILTSSLDYSAPVAEAQEKIAALRSLRVRSTRFLLLIGLPLWVIFPLAAGQAVFGFEFVRAVDRNWLLANLVFGTVVALAIVWASGRFGGGSTWVRKFEDALAGEDVRRAQEMFQDPSVAVKSPRRAWMIPAASTCLAVAMVAGVSLVPVPSLAQVAKAMDEHTAFTLKDTILEGGKSRTRYVVYRNGPLWRVGNTVGLLDETVTVAHYPPAVNYVAVDARREPEPVEFKIERLLRPGVEPKIERNVSWKGRMVDRFTVADTYRDRGRTQRFDQVILVDPNTSLPIQSTVTRDGSWTDVCDYDFTPPPASMFEATAPKGATVYDLRKQRNQLAEALEKNPQGAVLVDEYLEACTLTPGRAVQHGGAELRVEGVHGAARGNSLPRGLLSRSREHRDDPATLTVGARAWTVTLFPRRSETDRTVAGLLDRKQTTGSVEVAGKRFPLRKVSVIRTGSALQLLRSYLRDVY